LIFAHTRVHLFYYGIDDMDNYENFLEYCLFFNTNTLSRHLLKLAETEFKHLKLSPAHASLMLMLYDHPGISPKLLGNRLNLMPSTITRFLDALQKKKLIIRKSKGKTAQISPSKKGLEMKPQIAAAYKKLYLRYTQILGKDFANLLSVNIDAANKQFDTFFMENEDNL
jgi:DNA-binding MarR family transcriptional regulator